MVNEVLVDERGRARGVAYFDADDRLQEQTADLVVVVGGATESARLLLNSKSQLFPNGLGNRHDWVGRNLQGHAYAGAVGLVRAGDLRRRRPGRGIAICDFNHGNPGLRGGAMLANEFIRLPYQFSGRPSARDAAWGKAHKDFMRRYYRRTIAVQGPTQEMPVFDGARPGWTRR